MSTKNQRLPLEFYLRDDVVKIARDLLGKRLVSFAGMQLTSGIITETEAYNGIVDKASHAFGNRRTRRTETMYSVGGIAYIYFCYGMHSLFNVVTNVKDTPHAVLVRAIYPDTGLDIMAERLGRKVTPKEGTGPGRVTKILGLTFTDDKEHLVTGDKVWIENTDVTIPDSEVSVTPRVGVDYAAEDALLPYRFVVNKSFDLYK